jgi:hypothetical protein
VHGAAIQTDGGENRGDKRNGDDRAPHTRKGRRRRKCSHVRDYSVWTVAARS